MLRYIRTSKNNRTIKSTSPHAETLRRLGYNVTEEDGWLTVECNGVVEQQVDLSTPEAAKEAIANVTQNKMVFSYQTPFLFSDGRVLRGVFACRRLGKLSALVTRGNKGDSNTTKTDFLDDLLG